MLNVGQVHDLLGDPKLQIAGDIEGHHPHHRGQRAPLPVGVDPEAGQTGHREGEIVVPLAEKTVHRPVSPGKEVRDQLTGLPGEDLLLTDRHDMLVLLFADLSAGHDKQVGGSVLHRPL